MTAVVITTLGRQRTSPRVWLEGRKLAREGYTPGSRYRLDDSHKAGPRLVKVADGQRKVSSRKRQRYISPIIDVSNKILEQWFSEGDKLRIVIRRGRITIRRHRLKAIQSDRVRRLTEKVKKGEPLSVHSLFHGGGILDKAVHSGLQRAGINSVVEIAVERDRQYLDVSLSRHPELFSAESIFIEAEVQDVCPEGDLTCEVLLAGIPCTGASSAGRTKNRLKHPEDHPDAGSMFFYVLNWIRQTNPALIILENVPGYSSTASMSAIRSVLRDLGYAVSERVVNGCEFGALENRNRLCVVATPSDLNLNLDLDAVTPLAKKPQTLGEVLDDLPDNSPAWKDYAYLSAKEQRDKKAKKGFHRQLFDRNSESIAVVRRHYHKGGSTDPFISHPSNSERSRKINRFEHARVKGIDESYPEAEEMTETLGHEVMGQSVTPGAFESVSFFVGHHVQQVLPINISSAA